MRVRFIARSRSPAPLSASPRRLRSPEGFERNEPVRTNPLAIPVRPCDQRREDAAMSAWGSTDRQTALEGHSHMRKLTFPLIAFLGSAATASGQEYPPLAEYLMAPAAEVALARSAAPENISAQ